MLLSRVRAHLSGKAATRRVIEVIPAALSFSWLAMRPINLLL
jgi:hypothetical protein